MTDITLLDDVTVQLIDHMGSDKSVVRAARVSLLGANEPVNHLKDAGLINYLMRKKHGSPYEHTALTFFVKAPIFVFREFHRHRAGWSYNEMSGRYTKLPAEFYVPKSTRPLVNVGTSANPKFEAGSAMQVEAAQDILKHVYTEAWSQYEKLLAVGIGNEVARTVLPVGIMSQMYATCNLRALMHFLSLRTHEPEATFPSNPQHEIELVARKMEEIFKDKFPTVYTAWSKNGRVAP